MSFKEKFKKFWKEHWKEVAFVGGGLAVAGFACYKAYKSGGEGTDELEVVPEATYDSIEDRTAWNKDWNEIGRALEFATRQPLGPFKDPGEDDNDDDFDPLDGTAFIVAGYNSFYNDSPDTLQIYAVDNDGYFHLMPDDNYCA